MTIMMSVLLAGLASQPVAAAPSPPPVINTPSPRTATAPPAPKEETYPSRASASLPGLFSTDDYPAEALFKEEQGTVAISFAIDRDGRVTDCTITTSSGSPSLDSTTCAIVQSRARFRPARDAGGRRVADRTSTRIRWQLPPPEPEPFADRSMALVLTTDATGKIVNCRTEGKTERPADHYWCAPAMKSAKPFASGARQRVVLANRELVIESGILIGGPDAAKGIGGRPGETVTMLVAVTLDIDAEGTVSRCLAANGNMNGEPINITCARSLKMKFVPLDPAASDRSKRHAVRYSAAYIRPIR